MLAFQTADMVPHPGVGLLGCEGLSGPSYLARSLVPRKREI